MLYVYHGSAAMQFTDAGECTTGEMVLLLLLATVQLIALPYAVHQRKTMMLTLRRRVVLCSHRRCRRRSHL